jgi:hypothetical protein
MTSPWDMAAGARVRVIRPQSHLITDVRLIAPPADDDDPRFEIQFTTEKDRVLSVKLPLDVMDRLARSMLDLAYSLHVPERPEALPEGS